MASSTINAPMVSVYAQNISANVSTSISVKQYNVAILLVGNSNRTDAQCAMYVLFNNATPLEIQSSSNVIVVSSSGQLTVTSAYNSTVTILYLS